VILASSSQTRAELLKKWAIPFAQKSAHFDEERIEAASPKEFVYKATVGKMEAALLAFGSDEALLCADTVVTADNKILRKAKEKEDARAILLSQSGNTVSIITCTYLRSPQHIFLDISSTDYRFRPFALGDLEHYLASDTWRGKAGACMVEGFCKKYIDSVRGYESCAMGLSVEKLLPFLKSTH
jgi:septum formation protein